LPVSNYSAGEGEKPDFMIVNTYSITALSVDAVSLVLAIVTFVKSSLFFINRNGKNQMSGEVITGREDQFYLIFWSGVVLLVLRFFSWPFFYLVLESFVTEISGAMCIFGTTKLLPRLTGFLEIAKPLTFFIGFVWLLLFRLERFGTKTGYALSEGGHTVVTLLLLCTFFAALEAGGSLVLWIKSSAELAVSCCTTITDIPKRFTVWVPQALLGPHFAKPLWYIYYSTNIMTIVLGWLAYRSWKKECCFPYQLGLCAVMALANGIITVVAFIELVGPRLMGLSFHHCLYCLVQTVMDAPVILALLIAGSFSFTAGLPVWLLAQWADQEKLRKTILGLQAAGMVCLTGSLLMVTIHLVL
jgi:hypothetical protein